MYYIIHTSHTKHQPIHNTQYTLHTTKYILPTIKKCILPTMYYQLATTQNTTHSIHNTLHTTNYTLETIILSVLQQSYPCSQGRKAGQPFQPIPNSAVYMQQYMGPIIVTTYNTWPLQLIPRHSKCHKHHNQRSCKLLGLTVLVIFISTLWVKWTKWGLILRKVNKFK